MIEENLKRMGFSQNEVKVYLTLIRLGRAKAGEIIKETSLQRSVVYGDLEKLISRNLVSKSISKTVSMYTVNDPESFIVEAETQMLLAKRISNELKERQVVQDREVVVYEGKDIIRKVADKSLDTSPGSTIYFLGPSKFGIQTNLEKYWQNYHKKRIANGILCKLLYDQSTDPYIVENRNSLSLCEAQYLPLHTEMPISFIINDKMVGILVPSESPPLAFLIKSAKTADALKKYFEYLWNQNK
jgi:sugar-specific transcriptional regulator TrmB